MVDPRLHTIYRIEPMTVSMRLHSLRKYTLYVYLLIIPWVDENNLDELEIDVNSS